MNGTRGVRRLVAPAVLAVLAAACGGTGPDAGSSTTTHPERPSVSIPTWQPQPLGGSGKHADLRICHDSVPAVTPRLPGGPSVEAIRARGSLRVGSGFTAYGLTFYDPVAGAMDGFEVELAHGIARALAGAGQSSLPIEFVEVNVSEHAEALASGRVDLVMAAVTTTCERGEAVDFSFPYLVSHQRILVKKSSEVDGFEDLRGQPVCASAGSTSIERIEQKGATPVPARNAAECMVLLQHGEVQAVSTGEVILQGLAEQDKGTKIVGQDFERAEDSDPIAVAVALDKPDLVAFVNGVLDGLRADGTWDRAYDKWLDTDPARKASATPTTTVPAGGRR